MMRRPTYPGAATVAKEKTDSTAIEDHDHSRAPDPCPRANCLQVKIAEHQPDRCWRFTTSPICAGVRRKAGASAGAATPIAWMSTPSNTATRKHRKMSLPVVGD